MSCTSPSFENGIVTGQGDSFVANVPRPLPTLAALGIVQVACGESHNAALTIHGRVFTWGRGKYGALGLGAFDSSSWPQHVAALQEPACQVTTPALPVCNCSSMLCLPQCYACPKACPNVILAPKLAPILCLPQDMSAVHTPSLGWLPCRQYTKHCCNVERVVMYAQCSDSNEAM